MKNPISINAVQRNNRIALCQYLNFSGQSELASLPMQLGQYNTQIYIYHLRCAVCCTSCQHNTDQTVIQAYSKCDIH